MGFKGVQAKFEEVSQTANKVKNMFDIVFTLEGVTEKREKAADNLIVLAREKAGSELLYKEGVVSRIVRMLKVEKNVKIRLSSVRVIGELAKKDMERARTIIKECGLPFFIDAVSCKNEEMITAVTYAVQCIIDSLSRYDLVKKWKEQKKELKKMSNEARKQARMDEEKREEIMKDNAKELYGIMHVICHNTVSRTITTDPTIAFPGQRTCDVVRPIGKLLKEEVKSLENFEALLALGNLANVNDSTRNRMLKDSDTIMMIENYMFEDHQMLRRAAVQCVLNLCQSEVQVKRFEDKNDKMKYMVLLMGDADDQEVVKAAAGAVATLTSYSSILCNKVYESTQWESCFLNVLCSQVRTVIFSMKKLILMNIYSRIMT